LRSTLRRENSVKIEACTAIRRAGISFIEISYQGRAMESEGLRIRCERFFFTLRKAGAVACENPKVGEVHHNDFVSNRAG
jgi:hypothetical protein